MPAVPPARTFDDKRARIAALASASPQEAAPELRRLLADKNGYLIGEAAKVVAAHGLAELAPELAAAFTRLLDDPVKTDKGCHGKARIVEALLALDAREPGVYLAGIKHVQREPAFPQAVDTAAGLRGLCAHALFHIDHPSALFEVAPLLADPEPITRAEAASALGSSGLDGAAAALHVKALCGDQEPDVLGACYRALLRLLPSRYLPFVGRALLASEETIAEAAALALGESRLPEALTLLTKALDSFSGAPADSVLLGIALHRSDEASRFLLAQVENAPEVRAVAALAALALHRHDSALVERIRAAVDGRKSRKLAAAFSERFNP